MAFNFNWSPLIADTILARDLLTSALNKTPKPPIIVDDIIVTELNLGTVPPDLTLLEVGDLAQDRFRGVFKVTYDGDAFLTLRTKVQANPLNTELRKRRREGSGAGAGWCEPGCLAAHTGLTIPLQITLSDFRLSGFVILVFSRQKGLTLVFRNDPLESLKVSSTFDAIPFVRDYLQRTIEERLRTLFMEDLPAILHRLSLRLWGDDYRELDDTLRQLSTTDTSQTGAGDPVDPLASPPQDPLSQAAAQALEQGSIPAFALDPNGEIHATFSQKNLIKLGALTESQRTLSLFTPSIRDAVFRAWASGTDRNGSPGTTTPAPASHTLSTARLQSRFGRSSTSLCSGDSGDAISEPISLTSDRPGFSRSTSSSYLGHSDRRTAPHHQQRKKKHRVINLRRRTTDLENPTTGSSTPIASRSPDSSLYAASAPSVIVAGPADADHHRRSGETKHPGIEDGDLSEATPRPAKPSPQLKYGPGSIDEAPPAYTASVQPTMNMGTKKARESRNIGGSAGDQPLQSLQAPTSDSIASRRAASPFAYASTIPLLRTLSADKVSILQHDLSPDGLGLTGSSGGILEQAWLQKMAREVAAKVQEQELIRNARSHPTGAMTTPPGYGQ